MSTAFNYDHFEEPEREPQKPAPPRHRGWRIAGWIFAGLSLLIFLAVFAIGAMVNTDGVHRAILNFAQKKASEALGVRVNLQNFVLHWSTLSLDLYGISADGAAPHPAPPLLQVQHFKVGVRVVSVLHRKWYLDTLQIDRPIVWAYVDQNGVSNIPKLNSSKSSSNNNTLFDLGIRHAQLNGGEMYYNSRPTPLAADLHDLNLQAAFNAAQQMYSGTMGYRDGHLQYGAYRPVQHNIDLAFDLTPDTFNLKQAKLSSGNSQVLLSATVNQYKTTPVAQAHYQVTVDGGQMAQLLNQPTLPQGIIHASGNVQYRDVPNQPMLQTLMADGDLTSDGLAIKTTSLQTEVTALAAHYSLANGNATLRDLRLNLLGGEIAAQGTMANLGGDSHSNFSATVRNLSLAQVKRVLGNSVGTAGVGLAGTVNANASATWGKTLDNLVAKADASIHADVSSQPKAGTTASSNPKLLNVSTSTPQQSVPAGQPIPVESEIHANYSKASGQLQLANSYLRTRQTDLTLNGTVSQRSSLAIRLQANDLSELADIANSFHPPAANQQPLELRGTASFQGKVQGSTSAPHLTGQFTAMNLQFNGSNWKVVRTGVDASPDHAALTNADLEPATRGRITLNARAGLQKWAFDKEKSPLQAQLRVSQIDVQDLAKFASQPVPVTGTLNSSIDLHGTAMNPEGNGNLALTNVTAYQQPVQSLRADFNGNGDQAQANLAVQLPAGSVQAKITVHPRQRTYTAQLSSPGIHLEQLEALKTRNVKAAGVLQLNASGQGSFDNPQLNATLEIPSLVVSNQTVQGVKLQLAVANHVGNANLSSSALNTNLQAKATVHLTGDYMTDASLDTSQINFQPILALYSPAQAQNINGEARIQATLHGPLKNMKAVEAHLTIPVLRVEYQKSIQLAAAAPIQVNYKNGIVDVPQGAIRGTGTDIKFQGHIPTTNTEPMSLQVGGTLDLQLAQLFDSDIRSSGQVKLNIDSHGMLAKGNDIGGEIDVVNANFAEAGLPIGLQDGNGVLKLTTDRLNIAHFDGTVGGGKVALQGGVAYRPNLVFDLGLAADGVRMLYPDGMRETINANIRLGGTTTQALLGGNVDLTNLSFTPGFDLSSFAGQFSGGVEAPPSEGIAQNIKLNLAVHSSNNVDLVSRELSVNGSANLQVRGTAAQPVILGRVNLTGGDLIINGNRFVLTGGTVQFINPSQTEPVVNMTITTTIQEYNISLRFQGPMDKIKSEYTSDPSLPTADIIHLLAFGSTSEAAANNTTPANQEAMSMVASQVSSQVTSRISKVAGISQLSVSPVLQGGTQQGPPGANITIRQRVTGNLFITFSTNVATTQDQVIQGQYQVSPRVAISGTRQPNGGFGFDALIKNTW